MREMRTRCPVLWGSEQHRGGGPTTGYRWGVLLLVAHLAAVWFLVGLVWMVQVLVYPGFAAVGAAPGWREHHDRHTRLMGYVVTGPWAVQGVTTAWLLLDRPDGVGLAPVAAAAVCGLVTVGVTVGVSVPCHRRLSAGYDAAVLRRLVVTNRWRTAAWTLGGVVAVVMVLSAQ